MRARTTLTLAVVFTMGMVAGTLLNFQSLRDVEGMALEAHDTADGAIAAAEGWKAQADQWRTLLEERDASLQRCVEQKAHRAQAN